MDGSNCVKHHQGGNADLDEYKDLLEKHQYYCIERINGHSYSRFPVGVSILAVPFVYLVDKTLSGFPELERSIRRGIKVYYGYDLEKVDVLTLYPGIELFIASWIVAITACLIYLIGSNGLTGRVRCFSVLFLPFVPLRGRRQAGVYGSTARPCFSSPWHSIAFSGQRKNPGGVF